jgi:hypothetical protein
MITPARLAGAVALAFLASAYAAAQQERTTTPDAPAASEAPAPPEVSATAEVPAASEAPAPPEVSATAEAPAASEVPASPDGPATRQADAAPAAADSAAAAAADLAKRLDPTDFRSRIEWRSDRQSFQDGATFDLHLLRLEYAVSKKLLLRLDLPWTGFDPNSASSMEYGFGDVGYRIAYRAARSKDYALVIGADGSFDTARSPGFGLGNATFSPFAFLALDAPSLKSTFFPVLQHFHTINEGETGARISLTNFRLFILTRWPNRFYTGIENSLFIDHRRNDKVGFTLEAETGRFLTKHVAVWVRPGVGLLGDNVPPVYNWSFEVGARYLFD